MFSSTTSTSRSEKLSFILDTEVIVFGVIAIFWSDFPGEVSVFGSLLLTCVGSSSSSLSDSASVFISSNSSMKTLRADLILVS